MDKPEKFNATTESGYVAAYGTTPYEDLVVAGDDNLRMPAGSKYYGYMHVHLDKEGVVKIFSPADVSTFLTGPVRNGNTQGNMADAYAMVITSQGNYILKYTGNGNYGIGPNQEKNWKSWYKDNYTRLVEDNKLTQPNVENLFLQFLKDKVNISGLEIYKTDKTTGKASKLTLDSNNNVLPIPCP